MVFDSGAFRYPLCILTNPLTSVIHPNCVSSYVVSHFTIKVTTYVYFQTDIYPLKFVRILEENSLISISIELQLVELTISHNNLRNFVSYRFNWKDASRCISNQNLALSQNDPLNLNVTVLEYTRHDIRELLWQIYTRNN